MATCSRCGQENPAGFAFCGACGAALDAPAPPREVRKTVTVVFSDVAGSTGRGEPTSRLVRDAVRVGPVESLELKGKSDPISAYRLLTLEEDLPGRARRLDSPMVGRERELAALRQAYERAVGERSCHLFTVLG